MKVSTYLAFDGQCEEAFRLYERILNGKIVMLMKNRDSPMADQVAFGAGDRVMHASLVAGDNVLMGGDAPPGHFTKPGGFCVSLGTDSLADTERIFEALAENGKVQMPLQKTFFSPRFGMLIDRFGIPWMINLEHPM